MRAKWLVGRNDGPAVDDGNGSNEHVHVADRRARTTEMGENSRELSGGDGVELEHGRTVEQAVDDAALSLLVSCEFNAGEKFGDVESGCNRLHAARAGLSDRFRGERGRLLARVRSTSVAVKHRHGSCSLRSGGVARAGARRTTDRLARSPAESRSASGRVDRPRSDRRRQRFVGEGLIADSEPRVDIDGLGHDAADHLAERLIRSLCLA